MAKSRAQRKAERKKREQQARKASTEATPKDAASDESKAQHDTQVPVSGDVAEVEAVIETGAKPSDYGEHTKRPVPEDIPSGEQPDGEVVLESASAPAVPGVTGGVEAAPVTPDTDGQTQQTAPKPGKETRRQRKRREAKERKATEASAVEDKPAEQTEKSEKSGKKKGKKTKPLPETKPEGKQRGRFVAFLVSCWAELKRVQWPDRDTLIQASVVTIIFVAVIAAFLGGLDAVFSRIVNLLL